MAQEPFMVHSMIFCSPPTWHQSVMLVRPLPSLPWHCPCPGCFFFFTYKLSYLRFMTAFSKKKNDTKCKEKISCPPVPVIFFQTCCQEKGCRWQQLILRPNFLFIYVFIYDDYFFLAQGHADMLRCSRNPTSLPIPKTCWGVCKVPASWERGPGR